jgi:hypothetical protein
MAIKPQPPIKDWSGSREHRGRKWPVCGCRCLPCITTYVAAGAWEALAVIAAETP